VVLNSLSLVGRQLTIQVPAELGFRFSAVKHVCLSIFLNGRKGKSPRNRPVFRESFFRALQQTAATAASSPFKFKRWTLDVSLEESKPKTSDKCCQRSN
jgi:hypothetical protein